MFHKPTVLCLFAAFASMAGATDIAFYDGTFASGWTAVPAGYSGTSTTPTITLTPQTTGGFPGNYLKESHTLTGTNYPYVLFWVFNPANTFTGMITSLGYSFDLKNAGSHDVGYFVALQQGTTVYVPYAPVIEADVFHATTWTTLPNPYFTTGLTAANFCAIPPNAGYNTPPNCSQNPDFSSPSMTTTFGYSVGNSFGPRGSVTYPNTGIDNWCVVIYGTSGTPGPGAAPPGCGGVTP